MIIILVLWSKWSLWFFFNCCIGYWTEHLKYRGDHCHHSHQGVSPVCLFQILNITLRWHQLWAPCIWEPQDPKFQHWEQGRLWGPLSHLQGLQRHPRPRTEERVRKSVLSVTVWTLWSLMLAVCNLCNQQWPTLDCQSSLPFVWAVWKHLWGILNTWLSPDLLREQSWRNVCCLSLWNKHLKADVWSKLTHTVALWLEITNCCLWELKKNSKTISNTNW